MSNNNEKIYEFLGELDGIVDYEYVNGGPFESVELDNSNGELTIRNINSEREIVLGIDVDGVLTFRRPDPYSFPTSINEITCKIEDILIVNKNTFESSVIEDVLDEDEDEEPFRTQLTVLDSDGDRQTFLLDAANMYSILAYLAQQSPVCGNDELGRETNIFSNEKLVEM